MSLRVPTSTTYSRLERGLAVSLSRVQQIQGQLASNSRISKLSDDPIGASTGLRLRAQEASWGAYQRTADDATNSLNVTDRALQDTSDLLSQVNVLSSQAGSGGLDSATRGALADQIAGLRDQLLDRANVQHEGRAVLGGHRATAVAVTKDAAGVPTYTYAGDDGKVNRQVSPSVTVDVNLDGKKVLGFDGPAGSDVFSVLSRMETAVRTGDRAAVGVAQGELTPRADAVRASIGVVGALESRIDSATELGRTILDGLTQQRSNIEDVDLAETVLKLQAAENGYSAALGAVSRANLPSLASFLR